MKPEMTTAEARRTLEILLLKRNSGAMSPNEQTTFGQSTIAASIAKVAKYLTPEELYKAIGDLLSIARSEMRLATLDVLITGVEKFPGSLETGLAVFATRSVENDTKLDAKREALSKLLQEKLTLYIAEHETKHQCFTREEI